VTRGVFVTGATGYLGSYVVAELLRATSAPLYLLIRAKNAAIAQAKLWRALQLHFDDEAFAALAPRLIPVLGNLHAERLGIADDDHRRILDDVDSIIHVAAAVNRISEAACLNSNLRGTLAVLMLARDLGPGLRRFSFVSTVAVAGKRSGADVTEDEAIDWEREDDDPYGRSKKFAEHMARTLIPAAKLTIFRPAMVIGDSRHDATTQFHMLKALCTLARLPVVPFRGDLRFDIVNADWVGRAIVAVHMRPRPRHDTYHLSSGERAPTLTQILGALAAAEGGRSAPVAGFLMRFVPVMLAMARWLLRGSRSRRTLLLLQVFLPYITFDTVFVNRRIVAEIGEEPTPFTAYCAALCRHAQAVDFRHTYRQLATPVPARLPAAPATSAARAGGES
jgi:thioester reductase-like protein